MKKPTIVLSLMIISLVFISTTLFVIPARTYALPTPNKIVNHDDIASVSSYMDDVNVRNALSNQKWLFTHASVGENMKSGMVALKNGDARYVLGMNSVSSVSTGVTTSNGNIYEVNRGNPGIQSKLDIFSSAFNSYGWGSKVNIAMNKYCYIDIRDLAGAITVDDMPTYANQYINSMQALESANPGVTFVYMTSPTTNAQGLGTARIYAFNQLIRNYASSLGKYLFDVADIESYDPSGVHQVGNYSGNTVEMLYSGYTTDGGHPATTLGQQRLALGWYAMAISIAYNKGLVEEPELPSVAVTGITLNPTTASLFVGDSSAITATIAPSNATNKSVTWTSSDNSVATVTNGVIKAVKVGNATITATTVDGNKSATVSVTVTTVSVTGITLNPTTASLFVGDSRTITATIAPSNATNKSVTWTSSDNSVATVTNGVIKAVKVGNAIITAATVDGNKRATVSVTVTAAAVTGITLNPTTASLFVGDSRTITATIAPSNATNKSVTWTSSDNDVATVTNGVIKAVKVGNAIITAATVDGNKRATVSVTVTAAAVTLITLNPTTASLFVGDSSAITATIAPSNATNKSVTWTSSDNNVATVTNGVIKAVKVGNAIITAATVDGNKRANVAVMVQSVDVATVVINNEDAIKLEVDQTLKLKILVEPTNATNKGVTWKSSNTNIATVDNTGLVTALSKGIVTITVTTNDKNKVDKVDIEITEKVVPIVTVNIEEIESTNLDIGTKLQLNSNLESSGPTDNIYIWESSNNEIATVDQDGIVSGIKSGVVTITLKADNGKLLDKIKINIIENNRGNQLLCISIIIGGLISILVTIVIIIKKSLIRKQKEQSNKMTIDELMRS